MALKTHFEILHVRLKSFFDTLHKKLKTLLQREQDLINVRPDSWFLPWDTDPEAPTSTRVNTHSQASVDSRGLPVSYLSAPWDICATPNTYESDEYEPPAPYMYSCNTTPSLPPLASVHLRIA
ncbi:hypothetical protein N7539_008574 [Penicillium diatomitis]|uniref:Uncharacterized protein n=1 Tax=Penicillium diatomitis TaxID=2819901 RepID=A0A9W9WQV1_9EURO|nr:uncharacterized protein N7539_008574 [Penicillium diatomitis]KAJ5472005.1 hypothetical protein N7539_008574 [Penicillium diatomitis]